LRTGHAPTGRAPMKELFRSIWEHRHQQHKRMEYMSFVRTITLLLSVVAPQTIQTDGVAGRPET